MWLWPTEKSSIYAEGVKAGAAWVEYRVVPMLGAQIRPAQSGKLKINVEKMVYPFQNQGANWSTQDTTQWKGLAVGEAWYIDKALVDYIKNSDLTVPGNQGKLETRRPEPGSPPLASKAIFRKDNDSYCTPYVTYAQGFTMEFDYSFAKDHGDPSTGYVQVEGKGHQVSFVGNSGVKFGKVAGSDFEVNILDVQSMFLDGTTNGHRLQVQDNGDIKIIQDPENPKPFSEPLSKLMVGVRYGGDYRNMKDWDRDTNPTNAADFESILDQNRRRAGRMKIEVTQADGTYLVKVSIDGVTTYEETGISLVTELPHLQSHWGSGVVFENVVFA